jgi:hypothetical protein
MMRTSNMNYESQINSIDRLYNLIILYGSEESLVWLSKLYTILSQAIFTIFLKIFNRSYSFYASSSQSISEPSLRDYELWT